MCQSQPSLMTTNSPRDIATPKTTPLKFPAKLYRILNTPEFHDIICWLPHGRSWRVLQQERFEKEVLPTFFRHGRYASFIRQVNGWGFRRIQSGPDFNSYYHKSFMRDSPESCRRMKRPTAQEVADRKKEDFDSPPSFYLLSSSASSKSTKQESESAALPASKKTAPIEYKSYLISRLSICSLEEKEIILNLELEKLEEQRKSISKLLLALKRLSSSSSSFSPDESPLVHRPQYVPCEVPCEVPSFTTLQSPSPLDTFMRLSALGQMQLRSQLLASASGDGRYY